MRWSAKWSDSWLIDYDDYCTQEFKGNTGIYECFNDNQVEVIKLYFRWRTRTRFAQLTKNTSLKAKPKKAEMLSTVMGSAEDWVYDGCVDTGVLGGGHCALGHALRYEHYAFSGSTQRTIIFGANCAADFFGIEPDKLRKINNIQDYTLEEIKRIAFIRATGKHREYAEIYYLDIFDIINVMQENLEGTLGKDWLRQIENFVKAKLPLTEAMVERLAYVREKYYKQMKEEYDATQRLFSRLGGSSESNEKLIQDIKDLGTSGVYLGKVSKDFIMANIEEYAKSNNIKKKCDYIIALNKEYKGTHDKLVDVVGDVEKFANLGVKLVAYTRTPSGERIATVKEAETMGESTQYREIECCSKEQCRLMCLLAWCEKGNPYTYQKSGCGKHDFEEPVKLSKAVRFIVSAVNWVGSEDFERDIIDLAHTHEEYKYLEDAPDEVFNDNSIENIMDKLDEMMTPQDEKNNGLLRIARSIIDRHRKNPNFKTSEKQIDVIKKSYNIVKLKETVRSNDVIEINEEEPIKRADFIVLNSGNRIFKDGGKFHFHFSIAKSVSTYRKATAKQEPFVNEAYNALVEVLKGSTANKPAGINIIDMDDDTDECLLGNTVSEEPVEKSDGGIRWFEVSKSLSNTLPDKAIRGNSHGSDRQSDMLSIAEMSQALGIGLLRNTEE